MINKFRRFLAGAVIAGLAVVAGYVGLTAQSSHTYYVDFASGSNANPGTKASPWKSHPYMQHASGCTGGNTTWPGWSHAAGDQYIFKGGVTWPSSCFALVIPAGDGGSSISTVSAASTVTGAGPTINGADYYGIDLTWFTGGSFTRPIFDSQGTMPIAPSDFGAIITTSAGVSNVTFDDIELTHFQIEGGNQTGCGMDLTNSTNIVVNRMYIHDWVFNSAAYSNFSHEIAAVCGTLGANDIINEYNTTQTDQNTTSPVIFGTCFYALFEVAYNNCQFTAEGGLFSVGPFHDNLIENIKGTAATVAIGGNPPAYHTNGVESAFGGQPSLFYNNYFFNVDVGFNEVCPGAQVYNNVFSEVYNSGNSGGAIDGELTIDTNCGGVTASTKTYVYQNISDSTQPGGGGSCFSIPFRSSGVTSSGLVTFTNNICLGASINTAGATVTPVLTPGKNYSMSTSEAAAHGFVPNGKYSPVSSDSNVVGQGANLSSQFGTLPGLGFDASGTYWFGGAAKARPAAPDFGPFQFAGGTTGPPSCAISSPTSGGTMSGSASTLTVTCTPQAPATISNIQFSVDGITFGASGSGSSPYSITLDTTKLSNLSHTISVVGTDSNGQTGPASVSATVSNSTPGAFTTDSRGSTNPAFIQVQAITAQTVTFPFSFTVKPNSTGTNDSVIGFGPTVPTTFSSLSILFRANGGTNPGFFDAWNNAVGTYAAVNSIPYVSGTTYTIAGTATFTAGNLTSYSATVNGTVLASGYTPRAAATSLGFFAGISDNGLFDTSLVGSLQIGAATTLSISPTSWNFGNVTDNIGTPTQVFNITSSGGSTTFTTDTASGAPYSITADTCASSTTASCSITVQFAPTATGLFNGSVTLNSNATGSPQTIPLTGTGVAASPSILATPSTLSFGNCLIFSTCAQGPVVLIITNPPVTFTGSPTFGGPNAADFSLAANSCAGTIAAPTCQTVVSFTPRTLTTETGTITYTSGASNSPTTVNLTGTGVATIPATPSPGLFLKYIPPSNGFLRILTGN